MEAAIRFSQASLPGEDQKFLHVDVAGKTFKLCKILTQPKTKDTIIHPETVYISHKVPAFRAFDWHPVNEELVVVGQAGGETTLINIAEGRQDSVSFQVRSQRLCNTVALSSQNLLAAGLDKVRTDFCLNIWDFNQRLPPPGSKGFSKVYEEPLHKLGSGEPITSLKFFQDDPRLLVAGVKGQFVRLYDMREPSVNNGLQFATRCVYNLAIDWKDENYFASCYPTGDPSICIWDRRMISRSNGGLGQSGFSATGDGLRQPEVALELKNAIDGPGTIWSLRFSKSKKGCLGVLSSTGHLKVYDMGKDFGSDVPRVGGIDGSDWDTGGSGQGVFLDHAQDVERHLTPTRDEALQVVSFDFMTSETALNQPKIITLNAKGDIFITATTPKPEPAAFGSTGFISRGSKNVQNSISNEVDLGKAIHEIRGRAEPRNVLKQSVKQSRQQRSFSETKRMSSLANQTWYADLGFYEKDVPVQDLLGLTSVQRLRCEAGYLFHPVKNRNIASDSNWLQSFWTWVERAARISRHGNMTQDNLDLSNVGVFGLWMEDITLKTRTVGPSSNKVTKIIDNLVRRLNIPEGTKCPTEYPSNRQICLHVSGLAWSREELEMMTKKLVSQNQHTKAAALAIFANERKLAYNALRAKNATQSHKMLAMAIAGATKRGKSEDDLNSGDESDVDNDWSETVSSLAEELTDPYARAILAFVKSRDWLHVIAEESLPLKYRVGIALRHLDDSKLTRYISQATKDAIAEGDVEGVILTGTGTKEAFDLFSNYIRRFGDLQTAVLALCGTIPRYVDDKTVIRKFDGWKSTYREMMNSWGLKFDRVRFDMASQKLAVDASGRKLIEVAKPQVRLVCSYCTQSLAQFEAKASEDDTSHEGSQNGQNMNQSSNNNSQSQQKMVETTKHPLSAEKAAAIGTVCPKCGRHLPRCGVCDLWLGTPDESYLKWFGHGQQHDRKSTDLSASMTGSVQTAIGPGAQSQTLRGTDSPHATLRSTGTHSSVAAALTSRSVGGSGSISKQQRSTSVAIIDEDPEITKERQWVEMMHRFTVFCVKCSHGFHANHARMWFGGSAGREGHDVCPVPSCQCICSQ